jgi:hypothetical protein
MNTACDKNKKTKELAFRSVSYDDREAEVPNIFLRSADIVTRLRFGIYAIRNLTRAKDSSLFHKLQEGFGADTTRVITRGFLLGG